MHLIHENRIKARIKNLLHSQQKIVHNELYSDKQVIVYWCNVRHCFRYLQLCGCIINYYSTL